MLRSTDNYTVPAADRYDVILADPPWAYAGQQDKWGAAAKFYPTMTDDELLTLDVVPRLLADRGVLFMWATGPRLDFAVHLLEAWGLTYRGVAFVWVKTRKDGVTPVGAQGVRPSIVKPTTEFVLAASRVSKGRPMPLGSEAVAQVVLAPKTEHSRKPDTVHDRIEQLYPTASRLELFARRHRPGWATVGFDLPDQSTDVKTFAAGR